MRLAMQMLETHPRGGEVDRDDLARCIAECFECAQPCCSSVTLVRTFLSFTLEVELEGRWPWQRRSRPEPAA